ncbi:MAG: serine/threonine-protein kinase [Pirellula sp.]
MKDANERHPIDLLSEEFASRLRRGEHPSVEEYANKYPQHAEWIRSTFPSIALVERISGNEEHKRLTKPTTELPRTSDHPPNTLGDYEIVQEIGRGGMGVVYEAVQQSLNRHVALKVISTLVSGNEKHRSRFRHEAEAAASLHHTNIVPIYGIGEEREVLYYAMQLIDGVPLNEVIERLRDGAIQNAHSSELGTSSNATSKSVKLKSKVTNMRFDSIQAADWLLRQSRSYPFFAPSTASRDTAATVKHPSVTTHHGAMDSRTVPISPRVIQDPLLNGESPKPDSTFLTRDYFRNVARTIANAANAIDYAHRQHILHRDIKPANLLLDHEGTVWITDFGLARRTDLEGVTQSGEVLGTLRYMAPEQIAGRGDSRMDIYSLGLTLYELLTLRPAIQSPKLRMLDPIRNSVVPRLRAINPNVPRDLEIITLKACAYAPEHRYQTAGELEADLRRFLEDRPICAKKTTKLESLARWARRNPAIASLAFTAAGMLLCIAGLLTVWNRQQQRSIVEIGKQYDRAEQNLREKSDAFDSVRKEQARAEANLELAIQAFDKIADNISSRGKAYAAGSDLDGEDSIELIGADLSQADVALLESLLEFFNRFSEKNEKDLRIETANARQRVGDIQHKIGKLDEAELSYQQALRAFDSIKNQSENNSDLLLSQVAIYIELIVIGAKRGQWPKLVPMFQEARKIVDSNPSLAASVEGRFAMAKLLNNAGTLSARFRPSNLRPAVGLNPQRGFGNAIGPASPTGPPAGPGMRNFPGPILGAKKQEFEFNSEALQLLNVLVTEEPEKASFKTLLAKVLRDQARIERSQNEVQRAEESLNRSVEILEGLAKATPDSPVFQFELAQTLSTSLGNRSDMPRSTRALSLCDELLKENPLVPEYLALKASTMVQRSLMMHRNSGRNKNIEEQMQGALRIQRGLADRYSDIPLHTINVIRTLMILSELEFKLDHPIKAREHQAEARELLESLQRSNKGRAKFFKPLMDRMRDQLSSPEPGPNSGTNKQ